MSTVTATSTAQTRRQRVLAISLVSLLVASGTAYSLYHGTSLDTSNPILSLLPHPSKAFFAQKSNIFNVLFVKKAWGWTSLAFLALWFTSPPSLRTPSRIGSWLAATFIWAAFTTWFFGPALFDRLTTVSGGECIVHLPKDVAGAAGVPSTLVVPVEYCHSRSIITPSAHPALFTDPTISSIASSFLTSNTPLRPHLYRGHDVSGHIFLLTLSILFLVDQITLSLPYLTNSSISSRAHPLHSVIVKGTTVLVGLWIWMSLMTSVYYHTAFEKVTGLCKSIQLYSTVSFILIFSSSDWRARVYCFSASLRLSQSASEKRRSED
jgi:hypothetical protein